MAKDPNKEIEDSGKDLTRLFQTQTKSVKELHALLQGMSDGPINAYSRRVEKVAENLDGIVSLNRQLRQDLVDMNKEAAIKLAMEQKGLTAKMAELVVSKDLAMQNARLAGLSEEQLKTLEQQYDKAISTQKVLDKHEEAKEKEKQLAEKINSIEDGRFKALDGINAKMGVMKDILTDQRVAAAIAFSQINKGYKAVSHMISEVRKEGHTVTQAFHETGLAMYDAFSLGGTSAKDSLEVMSGMRAEMGSLEKVTSDARREAASLAKTFGISNQEAGKLTATFATMPGATMESANNSLEYAGNLAKAAGVAPGEVMKDIANSSEDVAAYTKDGGKNIGTAAVAAKKLGMEFGSLTKMADQLLDFESSINKQMEASVLLGKEINLDKAREAAMNGDLVGMTQEVLNNVGGEAEFNKMNMMQRKALADSLGVSVTDLGKMVKHQDELTNLSQEQQEALAAGELTMDEALANAGGLASKLWEGTKTVGSMVIGFGEITNGIKEGITASKELFGGFKNFREGLKGGGGIKGGVKGMLGGADKAGDLADKGAEGVKKATDVKAPSPAAGMGIRVFLQNLAAGLKSFGKSAGQILKGVGVLVLSGVMMGVGLGAIALAVNALGGSPTDLIMVGGALALFAGSFWLMSQALGKVKAQSVMQGALAMVVLGAALIPAAFAFSLLENVDTEKIIAFSIALPLLALAAAGLGFLIVPIALGAAALALLGVGMMSMGAGLMVMQAGAEGLETFQSFLGVLADQGVGAAVGAFALGGGMLALGVASFFAAPGLVFGGWALGGFASALAVLQPIMEMGGLLSLAEGLTALSNSAGGLSDVALAVLGIGGGLSMMALAGFAAMPIIGALVGLAAVAPALGGIFGGGAGGGSEEDKMQLIADKLDQLIAVASQGGEVKMDGKKVGEIVRLGLNTSNVR